MDGSWEDSIRNNPTLFNVTCDNSTHATITEITNCLPKVPPVVLVLFVSSIAKQFKSNHRASSLYPTLT